MFKRCKRVKNCSAQKIAARKKLQRVKTGKRVGKLVITIIYIYLYLFIYYLLKCRLLHSLTISIIYLCNSLHLIFVNFLNVMNCRGFVHFQKKTLQQSVTIKKAFNYNGLSQKKACLFLKTQKRHYILATCLQSVYNNVYIKYIYLLATLFVIICIDTLRVT